MSAFEKARPKDTAGRRQLYPVDEKFGEAIDLYAKVQHAGSTRAIVVATSGANDCLYCIIAHGAILRIHAKNPYVADQVAVNYREAEITEGQKAMLEFALKVAVRSAELVDADFEALRTHGFSDEDVWDIGGIAAFYALSNRMANLIAMRPNDEFYALGR